MSYSGFVDEEFYLFFLAESIMLEILQVVVFKN